MGRRVEGHAAEQCRIEALVRASSPRVLPADVFAWSVELARKLVRRGGATFAQTVSWSEAETARANKQVVGGEAETCRARQSLVVRGRDFVREAFP
jgi:hypothetical protein